MEHGRRMIRLLSLAGVAVLLATSCGQGSGDANGEVETEVVRLDTDGVQLLSTDMAICLREVVGIDVADDFLLADGDLPFDLTTVDPAQEQRLVSCFSEVDGAEIYAPAILEVQVDE